MFTKKRVFLTVAWVATSYLAARWAFQSAMDEALRGSEALVAGLKHR